MPDEWIRKSLESTGGNIFKLKGGKSRYILAIIICLGLLALIWPLGSVEKPAAPAASGGSAAEAAVKSQLTAELESILSQVDGAGKVDVSLTLSSTGIKSYASNKRNEKRETEETDSRGARKNNREENLTEDVAVSAGSPLLIEDKYPEVLGVLVVADGARQEAVQEKLTDATATLLNIPAHRVRVLSRKGEAQ